MHLSPLLNVTSYTYNYLKKLHLLVVQQVAVQDPCCEWGFGW